MGDYSAYDFDMNNDSNDPNNPALYLENSFQVTFVMMRMNNIVSPICCIHSK